ncbi:hypothetical protein DNTS_031849 [Danionella cerebrum]|uniref:Arf GTPase-activating protein GIT1/2 coiled-coil domain-containing protein n=1 Tax=Danionella cerebrum TaxID=2873325 RepID=A0A553MT05_9TELE|nr:hypothetical protein DNTS_031849 [Danionella translucida]
MPLVNFFSQSSESSDFSDSPITMQEFMEVKSALSASEAKIQQLLKVNCHLSEELKLMQGKLNSLQNENSSLKWQTPNSLARPQDTGHGVPPRGCRAMSMYETGSSRRPYHTRGEDTGTTLNLQPLPSNIGKGPSVTAFSSLPTFPSTLSWSWDERTQRVKYLLRHRAAGKLVFFLFPNSSEHELLTCPPNDFDVPQLEY